MFLQVRRRIGIGSLFLAPTLNWSFRIPQTTQNDKASIDSRERFLQKERARSETMPFLFPSTALLEGARRI
jgi:hypothetical protein